jgi:four helix bundle protein
MASYYQNLDVWKKAYSLNKELFLLLKKFPKEEQYSLVDQMRRSWLSIASNIAEWSGRWSNPDYIRFLHIAKWSAMELETQLLFSRDFWYIEHLEHENVQNMIDEVIRMIYAMIKNMKL